MSNLSTIKRLRSRLPIGLLAVVLLILVLLLVYQLWLSYRDQVRTAEISTGNFAAIFEARIEATLRRADADLKALAADIPCASLDQKAVATYATTVNSALDALLFNMEEMAGYRVLDANGRILYSSGGKGLQSLALNDQSHLLELRKQTHRALFFSDVVVDHSDERQILVIARALHDRDGNFIGVVHGMVDLDHYRKQFQSLDLGSQGVVALRRADTHAKVIRWPDMPASANEKLAPDHPVVLRMASGEKRLQLHYDVPPENILRIMSIQRMQKYPFYVAVGAGRDDVLDGWKKQAMVVAISTLLLFVLVGALLFRMGRMRVREAGILSNLAQSESQFRELAQIVPVGICHFDADGRYTYVNDRHMVICRRSREALMGQGWWHFVHPEDLRRIRDAWSGSGEVNAPFVGECRFMLPDGRATHVYGEVQAEVEPASGRVLGYIAALTDISELKRAEAELLVAQRNAEAANMAKTRFLAAASHDLRQPIQAISLFQDALQRTELTQEQKVISDFLSKSVHALDDLLHSLLDISKLDAGQIRPQLKPIQVEALFRAIDAEFSSLARQKNLRFKLFYPFKDTLIVTDADLMMRVLRNLIDNALKYTEKGGVLVGFRKRKNHGVIQIWDTGIGIESQYGDRIFEECFQVGNPARERGRGIGLGLSIVRRTAGLIGAEVHYRSAFGLGSVFEVVWPLSVEESSFNAHTPYADEESASSHEAEDFSRFKGWRVAVVEDDPIVAKSIELALGTIGVVVNVFGSAEAALSAPEIVGADFYISDFNLPGLNGLQMLAAIQQHSMVPVRAILVTGEASPGRIELTAPSRWKILYKPVALPALLSAMDDVANENEE